MATTMEIVQGISQIMANSYDGALDSEGQPIKVGLKRKKVIQFQTPCQTASRFLSMETRFVFIITQKLSLKMYTLEASNRLRADD